MNNYSGKLIVIDGTDGSGKTTQLNLLKTKLENEGYEVRVADFPQYNQKSAGLVENYLSGKYGQAEDITPYQASIFYAADRFDASFEIRNWLKNGKIVLANRYVSANMSHQGGKIDNPLERKAFFSWLHELEYELFNIPQPDLTIILRVEAEIAQKLAQDRARSDWSGSQKDIHENNLTHLKKAEKVYLEIAEKYPEFKLVSCTKNSNIISRKEIADLVWLLVKKLISKQVDNNKKEEYFRPIADIIGSQIKLSDSKKIFSKEETNSQNEKPILDEKQNCQSTILKVEKINPLAKLPQRAHEGDAGYDLYANDYYSIAPYGHALISTGIKMAIPAGYVGLIWDKSGLASEGIKTMGGVIDSSYRGEIKVIIKNLGENIYNIVPGQKIAQILIQKFSSMEISEENINDETSRQTDGFGSTGKF